MDYGLLSIKHKIETLTEKVKATKGNKEEVDSILLELKQQFELLEKLSPAFELKNIHRSCIKHNVPEEIVVDAIEYFPDLTERKLFLVSMCILFAYFAYYDIQLDEQYELVKLFLAPIDDSNFNTKIELQDKVNKYGREHFRA